MRIIGRGARVVTVGWCFAVTVLSLSLVGSAAAAEAALSPDARPRYVAGEVVVKLKDASAQTVDVTSSDVTLLHLQSKYGLQTRGPVFQRVHESMALQQTGGRIGAASSLQMRDLSRFYVLKTTRNIEALCAELSADPAIEYAQPNYIYTPCKAPDDPEFADQYAHQLIQMEQAWEISTGSRDVVVALIGTGVDVNHPDLKDNIWVNPHETAGNRTDDDKNGFVDDIHGWNFATSSGVIAPQHEHETEVAGVVAAVGNNGKGVVGVNWQCSLMVLQLSLDYTSTEVAAALDYAAANGRARRQHELRRRRVRTLRRPGREDRCRQCLQQGRPADRQRGQCRHEPDPLSGRLSQRDGSGFHQRRGHQDRPQHLRALGGHRRSGHRYRDHRTGRHLCLHGRHIVLRPVRGGRRRPAVRPQAVADGHGSLGAPGEYDRSSVLRGHRSEHGVYRQRPGQCVQGPAGGG